MIVDPAKFRHCLPPTGVRHRRKDPFRPIVRTSPGLRRRLQRIDELDHRLHEFILGAQDYFDLVTDAWAANFHASASMEGNPLSLEEAKKTTRRAAGGELLAGLQPHHQEFVQHVLSWHMGERFRGPWTVERIRVVHTLLTEPLGPGYLPGTLRSDPDRIQITGDDDTIWFEGAPGIHVQEELGELVRWLNEEAPVLHPLVAAALLFHEFESIHPFEDGNGRTGRVLFHLYIQNNGLPNSHKCMLEPVLTRDKDLYYRILAWTDEEESYTELIDLFVDAALEAYEDAVRRFSERDLLTAGVEENKKRILVEAKRHGKWFSLGEARGWVGGRSDATVRGYLQHWEGTGALESEGNTSAKKYRFRDPIQVAIDATSARSRPGRSSGLDL
jgi:Fic family protein